MIAVDTNIVIWAVQKQPDKHRPNMVERTMYMLEEARKAKEEILLPTPVIAEYLSGFPLEKQDEQRLAVEGLFTVALLNTRAAKIAAELNFDPNRLKEIAANAKLNGVAPLKIDVLIAAAAIAGGASKLYTDNVDHFRKLVAGKYDGFKIEPLPEIPKREIQTTLEDAIADHLRKAAAPPPAA